LGLTFKRGPKLLDLALQPDPLKHRPDKFNIIINIKNIIIYIIINIINMIINKIEKNIINIETTMELI
jgi:hypothetical protein